MYYISYIRLVYPHSKSIGCYHYICSFKKKIFLKFFSFIIFKTCMIHSYLIA